MSLFFHAAAAQRSLGTARVCSYTIEARLLEMQRKLSEIAEIPKILSSTLSTVSQTFEKLSNTELEAACYAHRKCSYDEDALDYELQAQDVGSDCESVSESYSDAADLDKLEHEKELDDDLVQVLEHEEDDKKSKSQKDVTPESDYASEANYATNEADSSSDEQYAEEHENAVYYLKLPTMSNANHDAESSSECGSSDEDNDDANVDGVVDGHVDNGGVDDDSDFLSTTYTWNLRTVPKLRISYADEDDVYDLTLSTQQEQQQEQEQQQTTELEDELPDTSKVRAGTPQPSDRRHSMLEADEPAEKFHFMLDNRERAWPWADREKIIYKQSTCHLVPRQPLGLVGQRIQLLAKQKLFNKTNSH